jgi:hypothetical protein
MLETTPHTHTDLFPYHVPRPEGEPVWTITPVWGGPVWDGAEPAPWWKRFYTVSRKGERCAQVDGAGRPLEGYDPIPAYVSAAVGRMDDIVHLRELCPPGSRVYTVLRHVSPSGMRRHIDLFTIINSEPYRLTGFAASVLGWCTRDDSLVVDGCGMDIGFHAVYELARCMYPQGFTCIGEGCPSNDHSNGDRDRSPHMHASGGYALKHRWL